MPLSTADVALDGRTLSLPAFLAVARQRARVTVRRWDALEAGRASLDAHVAAWRAGRASDPIYGVTTGFGSSRNVAIEPAEAERAQANLIRSHAVGAPSGERDCFDEDVVRGAALLRIHTFLAGRSGVRRELAELLVAMLNAGVHPVIPLRGSVGASGDLCPLAHFALVLMGEGHATVGERRASRPVLPGAQALREAGIEPLRLSYKEGLALINGTTVSSACLALALADAEVLARTADVACALGMEAMGAQGRALDAKIHASRGQAGQEDAAASLRALLAGSQRISTTDDKQDVYSFRCAPQVHGASRDAIGYVRLVVERELSAVTDNPLLFALPGDDEPWDVREHAGNPPRFGRSVDGSPAYSGGNFHGQPVALAADVLAIAVTELADIAERRLAILVNPAHSRGLPAHLARKTGLQSGLMIAQYTAASLVAECRTLAHPASVDNVPTGNGAEDHVSMSTWAARKARSVVALATEVTALELLAAAQANEWRTVMPDPTVHAAPRTATERARLDEAFLEVAAEDVARELGTGTAAAYRAVREISPSVQEDRTLAPDVALVAEALGRGRFVAAAGEASLPVRRLTFAS